MEDREKNRVKKVLKIRRYKAGYEIRTEEIYTYFEDKPEGHTFIMKSAYTPAGDYIGTSKNAYYLCKKKGIAPEKTDSNHCVCSIGYCSAEEKFYGWSHRAICGFILGDRLFEENYGDEDTLFTQHGEIVIENMEQAKVL